jgi:hypothetical protein
LAGLPSGIPGIGLDIEGAIQQAPQSGRHCIVFLINIYVTNAPYQFPVIDTRKSSVNAGAIIVRRWVSNIAHGKSNYHNLLCLFYAICLPVALHTGNVSQIIFTSLLTGYFYGSC